MGIALKGDFIGFWIGDTHSSELGIIRTSDGSRFNENLLPTIQDKTVQVPGGDGFYYFGSYYTQRQFNIPIAFDNMSEAQFRRLKQIIGSKEMVQLVFDEAPYKYYSVKSTGSPTLKYVCFDVEDESSGGSVDNLYAQATPAQSTKTRVYKGEGTLSFIAYDPFGYARALSIEDLRLPRELTETEQKNFSDLFDFENKRFLNENEWVIRNANGTIIYPLPETEQEPSVEGQTTSFRNYGDFPADYQIYCTVKDWKNPVINISSIQIKENGEVNSQASIALQYTADLYELTPFFCFDSKTNCVYSYTYLDYKEKIKYEKIYNKNLTASRFGKIPIGDQILYIQGTDSIDNKIDIKYRYL